MVWVLSGAVIVTVTGILVILALPKFLSLMVTGVLAEHEPFAAGLIIATTPASILVYKN